MTEPSNKEQRTADVKASEYLASPRAYLDPEKYDRVVVRDDLSNLIQCLITMRPEPDPLT